METGLDKARLVQYKAALVRLVGTPQKMRLGVIAGAVVLALAAAYTPLNDRIAVARARVSAEKKKLQSLRDVEKLHREAEKYRHHLHDDHDTNNWAQYLLAGSRQAKLGLRDMEAKEPRKVGPYRAVHLAIEVEGSYPRLKRYVEWLEQSPRLLRVESLCLERRADSLSMRVHVLGLVKK